MSLTSADLPDLSLPPQDEEIQRALAEVDARLSAFTAAVMEAQWSLAGQTATDRQGEVELEAPQPVELEATDSGTAVQSAGDPHSEDPSRDREAAESTAPAEPAAESGNSRDALETGVQPAAPPTAAQSSRECEQPIAAEVVAPKTDQPPAHKRGSKEPLPAVSTPAPAESPPAKPEPAAANDDEALLASLDAETASAIRVMRRLSFEKKSVRQLLEEYQASRPSVVQAEPRKKSWWSRG